MYAINLIFYSTLSKLIRPLMVLSFNSPKPTKGLDALTEMHAEVVLGSIRPPRASLDLEERHNKQQEFKK